MWYFFPSRSSLTPCSTPLSVTPIPCSSPVRLSMSKCRYGHPCASPGPGGCSVRIFWQLYGLYPPPLLFASPPTSPYACRTLYLYSLLNASSVIFRNPVRQKMRHSSRLSPTPLRNSVYWSRPRCFRWASRRRARCRFAMQAG